MSDLTPATPKSPVTISAPDLPAGLAAIEALTPEQRLAAWLDGLGLNTARAYARDLAHFAEHIGSPGQGHALMSLCGVRHAVALTALERYRDSMKAAGLASATINRRLSAVNSALAELAKADLGHGRLNVKPVPHEPRRDTKGPKIGRLTRVIDELAERTGSDRVRDREAAARDLAIVLLAAQRGLRRSEIVSLTIEGVDLAAGTIRTARKGKRERVTVQIATATRDALAHWLTLRASIAPADCDAVFVALGNRARGRAMGGDAIHRVIRRAGQSIGETWRPHGLRHSAITETLQRCHGSLAVAQEFAGHSSPTTTGRYIDERGRLERQGVDAMDSVFNVSLPAVAARTD